MKNTRSFTQKIGGLLAASLLIAPSGTSAQQAGHPYSRDIRDYVQPGLQDLSLSLKTGQYDQKAGAKISKEFGQAYEVSGEGMHYMQPDKIRLDGTIKGFHGVLVMDGFNQRMNMGWLHKSQDQSQSPGKVKTLLDVGLLNAFYLSYTVAQFQGVQAVDGTPCAVFRLSYPARLHDTSFRLLWIDPKTRMVREREEHGQDGVKNAVYAFRRPILVSGVWLPSEIDAYNAQGEFVGQTFIQNARTNSGLTAALFH